jgi:hypothetical protein
LRANVENGLCGSEVRPSEAKARIVESKLCGGETVGHRRNQNRLATTGGGKVEQTGPGTAASFGTCETTSEAQVKRKLYLIVVAITFLLGILHSTLAFVPYKKVNADTLWFLGTGLAFLFYSALNLIHARHGAESDVRVIVRVTNVLMLLFIALSVPALGVKGNPQVVVLVAAGILMLGLSFSN